jgi:hypothetical protein
MRTPAADFRLPVYKRSSTAAVDTEQGLRFVLSTNTPDLAGDVIEQAGLSPAYAPLPAMVDHGSGMAELIGSWKDIRNHGTRTTGLLDLLPAGVSQAADLVRAINKAGLLLAASIRFLPEDYEPIHAEAKSGKGKGEITGFRFLRAKLLECSVVAMPCNPEAVQLVGKKLPATHRAALDRLVQMQGQRHRETIARAVAAGKRASALLLTK